MRCLATVINFVLIKSKRVFLLYLILYVEAIKPENYYYFNEYIDVPLALHLS